MNLPGGTVLRRIAVTLAQALILPAAFWGAEPLSAYTVTPPPGLYSEPQLLSFSAPPGYRLEILVDGIPYDRSQGPLYLDTPVGSEREWTVSVIARSAAPNGGGNGSESGALVWKIDRKGPDTPSFSVAQGASGQSVIPRLNEIGRVKWMMWFPRYAAWSSGSTDSGQPIVVPYGAVLCAWGVDLAGNRGPAASFSGVSDPASLSVLPFKIVNPVPGSWSNRQALVVERREDLTVRYSIDGSDPAVNGLEYQGPVLLEAEGVVLLRVLISDGEGRSWSTKTLYSVSGSGPTPVTAINERDAVTETGEFAELFVNEGTSWGIGDGMPREPGGKAVLFTGVRGIHAWYPLTVSDGKNTWRHIIGCGTAGPSAAASSSPEPLEPSSAPVRILDWYFVAIEGLSEIFTSVDGAPWRAYAAPLFVDRDADHTLEWYSPSWKTGTVETVRLPAKPVLTGLPNKGITGEPVFLSAPNSAWDLRYRSAPFPLSSPASMRDSALSSGLLVETPSGSESRFKLSFLAVCDGIANGNLEAEFTIDRKAPRIPTLALDTDSRWTRSAVRLRVSGEDRIDTVIEPEARRTGDGEYLLEGAIDRSVAYTIRSSAVDEAGNRGGVAETTVTVDRNAMYVDPSWTGTRGDAPDGSPEAPYASLDMALETIRDRGSWRIYLQGNAKLMKPHTVLADVRLIGLGHSVDVPPGAFLTVSSGALRLEACSISADFSSSAAMEPLISVQNGTLALNGVRLSVTGPDSAILLRGTGADIRANGAILALTGGAYASAVDVRSSRLSMESSEVRVTARSVSALSLVGATADLRNTSVSVFPSTASRALEAWSSDLVLDSVRFERITESKALGDTALWTDAGTKVRFSGKSAYPGFQTAREIAPR